MGMWVWIFWDRNGYFPTFGESETSVALKDALKNKIRYIYSNNKNRNAWWKS